MSDANSPHIIDLLSRLSDISDGTMLVWCIQFKAKGDVNRFVEGKEPPSAAPSDRTPLPGRPHANGKHTDPVLNSVAAKEKAKTIFDYPLFTQLGLAILRAVSHEWQSAAELASACGCANNTEFYDTLRALAERELLERNQRHGWRLSPQMSIEEISQL